MKEPFPPSIVDVKFLRLKSFPKLFDGVFRFPRAGMFFLLMVRSALENISMEAICDKQFESSDRFFFYLSCMSVEQLTGYCNMLLHYCFKMYWKDRRRHRPVLLAVDTSDVPFEGRDNEYVHHTVKRRGLKMNRIKVLRYACISIVSREFKLTLAVRMVKKGEKLEDMVDRLLEQVPSCLKVRAVLMDKGFYYSEIFKTVEKHRLKYIVPIKRYDEMGLWYHIAEITDRWRFRYTMNRSKKGRTPYTFNVYLQDMGVEDYIGYASNLDMSIQDFETLTQAYRYRWNIENGFKECKNYQVKTNTRNNAYRILVYMISHLLMNLHILTRKHNKTTVTIVQMRMIFTLLLTMKHGTSRMTKRITIIY